MTDPTEDFAAMFEASIQAKRFEKGETLLGTIVAIGPEVAFVDVGGKGEATIEISLGLKQLTDDPWSSVRETYGVGQVRTGRVATVADRDKTG